MTTREAREELRRYTNTCDACKTNHECRASCKNHAKLIELQNIVSKGASNA